jgi:predicted phage terminase large subunit-like protein
MISSLSPSVDQQVKVKKRQPYIKESELVASITRQSFYEFLKEFWETVNPEPFVDNFHIKYMCEVIQHAMELVFTGKPREGDHIINLPPGLTKSLTYSVMLPAWAWTRMPHCRFICASHTQDLVLDLAVKCRDVILSKKYQECFPEIKLRDDQNNKGYFRNTHGGMRFCCTVAGKTPTGMHGHVIVVDDPIDPNTSELETGLKKANRFMTAVIPSRRVKQEVSVIFLVMQRLHENDPTGHLLNKKDLKTIHHCLPERISDNIKPAWLRRLYLKQGGLLDPRRLPDPVLKEIKSRMGDYDYAGQYAQTPTPAGGGLFKIAKLRIVDSMPTTVELNKFDWILRYWDKAATEDGGCDTAGVKMGRVQVGWTEGVAATNYHPAILPRPIYDFWVFDVEAGQWGTEEREAIIYSNAQRDGRDVSVRIEREPGSSGIDSVKMTLDNLQGYDAAEDLPTGDKVVRARPFAKEVNNGRVVLVAGPWNEKYIRQLQYFPRSTMKDMVDASSGALNTLMNGRLLVTALS